MKEVWESIYRRRGGNGAYTRLFEDLEQSQQATLLAGLAQRDAELPVIGSLMSGDNWLILSTERLVWCADGKRSELPLLALRDTHVDRGALRTGPSGKTTLDRIEIVTFDEGEHVIRVEPGPPFFGFLNVLKNIGTRNRNRMRSK